MSQYDDIYSFDEKPKRKRDEDPTTWLDAWKALGFFTIVMGVYSLIVSYLQHLYMGDAMQTYFEITLGSSDLDNGTANFLQSYATGLSNPLFYIIVLLLTLVMFIAGLFIVYGLLHVVATKLMGGVGTLRGLIVRANRWTLGIYIVSGLLSTIASSVMILTIAERFADANLGNSAAMNEFTQALFTYSSVTYGILFITWLGWNIAMSFVASKNYKFSTGKGCMSLFMTNIALLVLFCGISFALGFAVVGMMMAL